MEMWNIWRVNLSTQGNPPPKKTGAFSEGGGDTVPIPLLNPQHAGHRHRGRRGAIVSRGRRAVSRGQRAGEELEIKLPSADFFFEILDSGTILNPPLRGADGTRNGGGI